MSLLRDIAREGLVRDLCEELARMLTKTGVEAEGERKRIKEVGLYALRALPNAPEWSREFYRLFKL